MQYIICHRVLRQIYESVYFIFKIIISLYALTKHENRFSAFSFIELLMIDIQLH